MVTALDILNTAYEGKIYRGELWKEAFLVESVNIIDWPSKMVPSARLVGYSLTRGEEKTIPFSKMELSRLVEISSRDLSSNEAKNLAYREAEQEGRRPSDRPAYLQERVSPCLSLTVSTL